jgi:hypothetical protein
MFWLIIVQDEPRTYGDGEQSWITSPSFNLSQEVLPPILKLRIIYDTDVLSRDGVAVQYSVTGGHWETLGAFGDAQWYNDGDIEGLKWSNTTHGWSGSQELNDWITVEHPLPPSASSYSSIHSVHFHIHFCV